MAIPGLCWRLMNSCVNAFEPASFWTSGVHPLDFGLRALGALTALWGIRFGLGYQGKRCLTWYLTGKGLILMGLVLQWAFAPGYLPRMDTASVMLALIIWVLWPIWLVLCWLKAQNGTNNL